MGAAHVWSYLTVRTDLLNGTGRTRAPRDTSAPFQSARLKCCPGFSLHTDLLTEVGLSGTTLGHPGEGSPDRCPLSRHADIPCFVGQSRGPVGWVRPSDQAEPPASRVWHQAQLPPGLWPSSPSQAAIPTPQPRRAQLQPLTAPHSHPRPLHSPGHPASGQHPAQPRSQLGV